MEEWLEIFLDENKRIWTKVEKKKSRDPSPVSPATTKSQVKSDVGVKPKIPGRKNLSQTIQEETRRNLADGSQ